MPEAVRSLGSWSVGEDVILTLVLVDEVHAKQYSILQLDERCKPCQCGDEARCYQLSKMEADIYLDCCCGKT